MYAKCLHCPSWKKLCGSPYQCFSVARRSTGMRKWHSWNEIVQLVELRRSGVGKYFLRWATLLSGAAYITFDYFSCCTWRFTIWVNEKTMYYLCACGCPAGRTKCKKSLKRHNHCNLLLHLRTTHIFLKFGWGLLLGYRPDCDEGLYEKGLYPKQLHNFAMAVPNKVVQWITIERNSVVIVAKQ